MFRSADGVVELAQVDMGTPSFLPATNAAVDAIRAHLAGSSVLPPGMTAQVTGQAGIGRDYLLRERRKAYTGVATEECKVHRCSACGVCDFEVLQNRLADETPGSRGLGLGVREDCQPAVSELPCPYPPAPSPQSPAPSPGGCAPEAGGG